MNKEQQDKLWDDLSEEEKQGYREWYKESKSIEPLSEFDKGKLYGAELIFGSHNLNPTLTYEDINAKLYEHKSNIIQFMNTTSIKHEKKINAINKLLEVAKYLNGDWKPDWKQTHQKKFYILIDSDGDIHVDEELDGLNCHIVYFSTQQLAEQAIQILGEETIRLALGDY